ncbi:MAG: TRC40/GET3/ArsA family transport-energizing ATPase [Archaeoglobales archaeon]|nr:TRC40/GET3/ArsA family transport-energizing ATPase [Archaeoglobales archaeon]
MRIILFTGKGGVGKTTMAAASAIKATRYGYKTLVMSADPAHNLSDCFQKKIEAYPTKIAENLYGMEINVQYELERRWDVLIDYIRLFFKSQGIEDVISDELAIPPGLDELVSLLHLLEFYEKKEFDVIILDCAPTGETLRLLSLPEVARWFMNRFFGIEKKLFKLVKPVAQPVLKTPLPNEDVLDTIQELYIKIAKLKEVLESEETTVRLVLTPEKIAINESQRAFAYINLFGYRIDCLIVNKLFPSNSSGYLSKWIEIQQNYLNEIKTCFPVPIFTVEFKDEEISGEKLFKLAEELYDSNDPTKVFFKDEPFRITKEDEEVIVSIKTPFLSKETLKVMKRGEEIIISADQWKRVIFLPQSLAFKKAVGAKLINGELKIRLR